MFLGLPPEAWGAVFLVIAVLLHFLRVFTRSRAVLAFLGTCLLGAGLFRELLVRAATEVSRLTDSLVGKAFGVAVPGLLVVVLGIIFLHDLHPSGGGASRRTMWLGIALGACLIAGVSAFPAVNQIPSDVHTTVATVTSGG
jgi:hypothetical protein